MRLSARVLAEFRRHGRRGGLARARNLPKEARTTIARRAALRRWVRLRFGVPRFSDLGLPGASLIDAGLDDLAADRESVESLLVSLASSRLKREGVPLPARRPRDPEERLYRRLAAEHGPLAHARYLALIEQLVSFADACGDARRGVRAE
jgi:hypothetical protein